MTNEPLPPPNIPAIVDKHVRRFLYDHGATSALAPHEVEGYIAEVRAGLADLDALGDDITPRVRAIREETRLWLGAHS